MRVSTTSEFPPIDVAALVGAIPLFADSWRHLTIAADGVRTDDGRVLPGLAVTTGTHPVPGAQYRITSPRTHDAVLVDLIADDASKLRLGIADAEGEQSVLVEIEHPLNASAIEASWAAHLGDQWPMRGGLHARARVEFAGTHPRLTAEISHRYLTASAEVTIDERPSQWESRLDVHVHIRGWLRPVGAVVLFFTRRTVRRRVEQQHADISRQVTKFNEEMTKRFGTPPSSQRIADGAMAELLDAIK